ncbi:MAG: hypothetical protein AAB515_00360 [Patescibacteria group bacterium]
MEMPTDEEVEALEKKHREGQEADKTSDEQLAGEVEDEFEEPEEPTEEDKQLEAEMELTGNEEKWLAEMKLRVKEWKHDTSKQPYEIQDAIRKIHEEQIDQPEIVLFHAFQQMKKSPSAYFKQKFGRALRAHQRETRNNPDSTGYQLTKILKVLSEAE